MVVEVDGDHILIVGCGYPGLLEILGRAMKAVGAHINIVVGGLCEEALRGEAVLLAETLEKACVERIYLALGNPRGTVLFRVSIPRGA